MNLNRRKSQVAITMLGSAILSLSATNEVGAQWQEGDIEVLLEVDSTDPQDLFGWTVVPMGDVTGDGVIDFAVSAVFTGNSFGSVFGISGADGSEIWRVSENRTSAIMGYAMEQIGDWNNDGFIDVIAGAPFNFGGRVWVLSGVDGEVLHIFNPGGNAATFGVSIATGGDFDGDGIDDVVIADFLETTTEEQAGRVYVYSIPDASLIATIDGANFEGEFGIGLAYLDDTDGDNRDELVIGERLPDFWSGLAHVYEWDGAAAQLQYTVAGVGHGYNLIGDRIDGGKDLNGDGISDFTVGDMFLGEVDVFSGDDGTPIYTIFEPGEETNLAANQMIDDIDGDGIADLIVAAWGSDAGAIGAGKVFLYSGIDGSLIRTMTYEVDTGRAGADVRAAGDLNGDGTMDFVVGATGGGFNGPPPGRFFVISGSPLKPSLAAIVSLEVVTGTLLGGDIPELLSSDNTYVHSRSGFGVTLIDLHNMEMIVSAETLVDAASSIDLTVESRIDEPAGLAQIELRNWNTNQFEFVASYSIGNSDNVDTFNDIDATNYIDGSGNIDVSIKHIVFVPFLAFTFESFLDQVEISVR